MGDGSGSLLAQRMTRLPVSIRLRLAGLGTKDCIGADYWKVGVVVIWTPPNQSRGKVFADHMYD